VDLFAGAGGLSLGLEQAGFDLLVGADSEPWAVETHVGNLGGLGYCGDLSDPTEFIGLLDSWGIESVDLLAGGVPCQPFSRAGASRLKELVDAGRRLTDDPRVHLWQSFMQVVEHLQPRMVLVENVPDLPRWNNGAVLAGFYESLQEIGYRVDARVLEGWRHGVPQHRARMILIARNDRRPFVWPEERDQPVTLRQAIGDLPVAPPGQRRDPVPYRPRPGAWNAFVAEMREQCDTEDPVVHDHITRGVRADDHEAYVLMREGQTYRDIPQHLQRYRSDIFTDKYKRLAWDEVSRTITAHIAKDGYWYIHPEQHRTLSIREAARVQTFPDHFRFAGNPSHRFKQIGNAVPPRLGRVIGEALLAADRLIPGADDNRVNAFRRTLEVWYAGGYVHPWRHPGTDPWFVLMGEVFLRRARPVDAEFVFDALRRHATTPATVLRHADWETVLPAVAPSMLRRHLPEIARALVDHHGGRVPDDPVAIAELPKVGEGAALAVHSFGFDKPVVLLDSGMTRVVSRLRDTPKRRWQQRLDIYALAGQQGPDARFNAAIHELGATFCRHQAPLCVECPVRDHCRTGRRRPVPDGAREPLPFESEALA
jgi:DNA (cytosine-5)-methyltransferase 1